MGEITALEFSPDNYSIAIGNEKGKVQLYDIRYPLPVHTLTHHYRLPIKAIKFHEQAKKIITADSKIIKIFDQDSGKLFTNIEPKNGINDIELPGDGNGLLFAAQEQAKVGTYFIPQLGPAPKWCSFLENLTEELEESKNTSVYEDFKFVTKTDLEKLNATNLIGTDSLRAYMHGYFMQMKQYQQLASIADPFAYDKFKKKQVETKLDELRDKRIIFQKDLPKVNKQYVRELLAQDKKAQQLNTKKAKVDMKQIMEDSRFGQMFTD
jgi:ribosome biogenesis protein ENP2